MMALHEHLVLPKFDEEIDRKKRDFSPIKYDIPEGREKGNFSHEVVQKANEVARSFNELKKNFIGKINPALIYQLEVNQGVSTDSFEKTLGAMGIHILSVAENKKGYWVVFSNDENLDRFKKKLNIYGSEFGPKYEFFNAIETLCEIPKEEKIGKLLKDRPLSDDAEYLDIELWKIEIPNKNKEFINELKKAYPDQSEFRITDTLITNSFVLLRVKLTKNIFDEIIELREIARADRPSTPSFNPFDYKDIDISSTITSKPEDNAQGILIIDSGIVSNHPLLEKCIGGEENFQSNEPESHDTVGHGTAVAGCAAYGDIEKCIESKSFIPSNWIFSAKVMYGEKDFDGNVVNAIYDPEKLIEHQFKDAIESFLFENQYQIKVVVIALGNSDEIWQHNFSRQLPLAAIIDELAFSFPLVTFIVAAGNQNPRCIYDNIGEIVDNYPKYLIDNNECRLNNPATSALAITVGSITGFVRYGADHFGYEPLKTVVAEENQPSPFTRVGFGVNGMVKPELVGYGGNLILSNQHDRIIEDVGGKLAVLNNQTIDNIIQFDYGTSYSTPKIAQIAGRIANAFPDKSANFIKNMLLVGADYPFIPDKKFYGAKSSQDALFKHLKTCGYGLPSLEKAVNSFDNRVVLFDEGALTVNRIKVFTVQLPSEFFQTRGRKKISVVLTFTPETRSTRGDSYLGNRIEFHLYHTLDPKDLVNKFGALTDEETISQTSDDLKKYEISLFPGINTRKAGCHQKGWKEYKREPNTLPVAPISLVLLNINKWIIDEDAHSDYCVSVTFEHENENELYNKLKASVQIQARARIR